MRSLLSYPTLPLMWMCVHCLLFLHFTSQYFCSSLCITWLFHICLFISFRVPPLLIHHASSFFLFVTCLSTHLCLFALTESKTNPIFLLTFFSLPLFLSHMCSIIYYLQYAVLLVIYFSTDLPYFYRHAPPLIIFWELSNVWDLKYVI